MSTPRYKRGHRSWSNGRAVVVVRNDGRGSASLGDPERVSIVLLRSTWEAYATVLIPSIQCLETLLLLILKDLCPRQRLGAIPDRNSSHGLIHA